MAEIVLEPTGSNDFECCECCGENSRTVWGLARRAGAALPAKIGETLSPSVITVQGGEVQGP